MRSGPSLGIGSGKLISEIEKKSSNFNFKFRCFFRAINRRSSKCCFRAEKPNFLFRYEQKSFDIFYRNDFCKNSLVVFLFSQNAAEVLKLNFADTGFKKLKVCSGESTQSFAKIASLTRNINLKQLVDINARHVLSFFWVD